MNQSIHEQTSTLPPVLRTGRVRSNIDGRLRLVNGSFARVAASCWLEPEVDDLVCCLESEGGALYVLHILERHGGRTTATVALRGIDELRISTKDISMVASRKLTLGSLLDCDISAATGALRLSAQDVLQSATGSLLQVAGDFLLQADTITQRAKGLLSSQARRQLIIADKEIRVDGEIIQMG